MWTCKDWTELRVRDMTDSHLVNAAKYLVRGGNDYDDLTEELKIRWLFTKELRDYLDDTLEENEHYDDCWGFCGMCAMPYMICKC